MLCPSQLWCQRRVVGQHEWPIVMRDRASRAMPMSPCHTGRHDKHGVLKGKCSLIPGFRDKSEADAWIVQTKRMLHELDPTDRVIARKSGKHG